MRDMEGGILIYGLTDPETGDIRYVGKTKHSRRRMYSHRWDGRNQRTHKSYWLRSLFRRGLEPGIVILEEVTEDKWQEAEMRWIAHYRELGVDLTNSTQGGEGVTNPTQAVRDKIGNAKRGQRHSEETKRRISEAKKGNPGSKGYRHTEEAKRKMALAKIGTKHHFGFKATPESRERMSAAQRRRFKREREERRLRAEGLQCTLTIDGVGCDGTPVEVQLCEGDSRSCQ